MFYSPLRYPGGKQKITPVIENILQYTGHAAFIEPFAGGAGVSLELLFKGTVNQVILNDFDKGIYSFWNAVLTETDRFIKDIEKVNVTVEEWERQKHIYINSECSYELGFATFFLNRTNRSGIIKGGMIGGVDQTGKYKINARFNKKSLIKRIEKIGLHKDNILLYNEDIGTFINNHILNYPDAFIFFDPPYYKAGKQVYSTFFTPDDHIRFANAIKSLKNNWIITYDNSPEIKEFFADYVIKEIALNYSITSAHKNTELIIFSNQNFTDYNKL